MIEDRLSMFVHVDAPARVNVFGDRFLEARGQALIVWDALGMTRVSSYQVGHSSYCYLEDGGIAAFSIPPGSDHAVISRVDRTGSVTTLYGPYNPGAVELYPGRSVHEYVGIRDDNVVVFVEDRGRVAIAAVLPRPEPGRVVGGLGAGRVVTANQRLVVMDPRLPTPTGSIDLAPRFASHLSPSGADLCWIAYGSEAARVADHGERIDALALYSLAGVTTNPIVEVQVGTHEHILRIAATGPSPASADAAIAVFVLAFDPSAATIETAFSWWVLVFEASGKQRWRAQLPKPYAPALPFELSRSSRLLLTATRVVLLTPQPTPLAWDAMTGVPVVVP